VSEANAVRAPRGNLPAGIRPGIRADIADWGFAWNTESPFARRVVAAWIRRGRQCSCRAGRRRGSSWPEQTRATLFRKQTGRARTPCYAAAGLTLVSSTARPVPAEGSNGRFCVPCTARVSAPSARTLALDETRQSPLTLTPLPHCARSGSDLTGTAMVCWVGRRSWSAWSSLASDVAVRQARGFGHWWPQRCPNGASHGCVCGARIALRAAPPARPVPLCGRAVTASVAQS
jgi:hypothetical protein